MSEETTPTTAEDGPRDGPGDGRGAIDETWSWEDEARKLRAEMAAAVRAIVAQGEERKALERELGEAREALKLGLPLVELYAKELEPSKQAVLVGWAHGARAALAPKEAGVKIADTDWADHEEIRGLPSQ